MTVRVAATLRLADHIAAGTDTAPALAAAVEAHPDALARMLRHLAYAGVLDRVGTDPDRYALTEQGEALRDDHPDMVRARLDVTNAVGRAVLSVVEMPHTIRTGETAFSAYFGRTFWEDLAADPERSASFDAAMAFFTGEMAQLVATAYDWGRTGHLVDVGGGSGALLGAVLRAHPGLRGTVFDLPGPVEGARRKLAEAGLADRADAVAGDFFEEVPAGAGGYLLSSVLHDWNDRDAVRILRRCAEAAGRGGSVFVAERIGAEGEEPSTEMDMWMLMYLGGRERDVPALTDLARTAGLTVLGVHRAGAVALLELAAV
ncbi:MULTISPECIES: methyltransferase [Streptomyces]|uniref:Methyltransferase n=2 Tax=Streptomyces TaxID=1883 RepID=A0ABQ7FMI3_9ACTN|nr:MULTISPECIES: methyltransferase [Streptomyces]KAF4408814.1 methyltransferase [Streptomyces lycii]PGH48957.1 methyltransferase [Streptomyces sp. Ru87]